MHNIVPINVIQCIYVAIFVLHNIIYIYFYKMINEFTSIMWFNGKTAANPILLIITNQENPSSIAEYPILASVFVLLKLTVSDNLILKWKKEIIMIYNY